MCNSFSKNSSSGSGLVVMVVITALRTIKMCHFILNHNSNISWFDIAVCGVFVPGFGVVTYGLTASICTYVACVVFRRKTDFEFDAGFVLMPDDVMSYRLQSLQSFISKL